MGLLLIPLLTRASGPAAAQPQAPSPGPPVGLEPTLAAIGVSSPRQPRSFLPPLSSGLPGEGRPPALAAGSRACLLHAYYAHHILSRLVGAPQENPVFLRAGLGGVPRVVFRGCLCHRIWIPIHVCGVGFCDTSQVSDSSLNSDTICLQGVCDPTGQGLTLTRLPALQAPIQVPVCQLCF